MYPGEGYVRLQRFKWGFSGLNELTQHELPDFTHFSCVLAHEYFGDLASGKIFIETNWRPSVSTRGRGTSFFRDLNGRFRSSIFPYTTHFRSLLIFRVC